jgi:type II secretory pathway component PulF
VFIFTQNKERIVNTGTSAAVFVEENTVRLTTTVLQQANISFSADNNAGAELYVGIAILAEYANEDRAKEVLHQIFKAMKDGQPTFEMPEK